jgi:hypothetical protein
MPWSNPEMARSHFRIDAFQVLRNGCSSGGEMRLPRPALAVSGMAVAAVLQLVPVAADRVGSEAAGGYVSFAPVTDGGDHPGVVRVVHDLRDDVARVIGG